MTPRVAILDYGCGNLASVANAVRKVGGEPFLWPSHERPWEKGNATHFILPGQGHFAVGARRIPVGAVPPIPTLGICLGMQLMCEGSEEAPGVKGLGWLPYQCIKMPVNRLPHIGWNAVHKGRDGNGDYYFCHSYAVPHDGWVGPGGPARYEWITDYEGWRMAAAIFHDNLWAVQFHPEKSGRAGLALLAEFLKL